MEKWPNPYRIQQIQVKVPRFHKSNQTCASSSPGWLCRITSSFLHIKIIYLVSMKKNVSRLGSVWALRELSWTFFRAKSAGNHFPPTSPKKSYIVYILGLLPMQVVHIWSHGVLSVIFGILSKFRIDIVKKNMKKYFPKIFSEQNENRKNVFSET